MWAGSSIIVALPSSGATRHLRARAAPSSRDPDGEKNPESAVITAFSSPRRGERVDRAKRETGGGHKAIHPGKHHFARNTAAQAFGRSARVSGGAGGLVLGLYGSSVNQ